MAVVAFVRKRVSEIQYLKTTISDQQRREFGQLVGATVSQIEAGQFPSHSGIRFPQNGCVSCAQLGLCLGNQHSSKPSSSAVLEPVTLIGLTSLTTNGRPLVAPKLNRRRALFVLSKIDEILAWEKSMDRERDSRLSIWAAISVKFAPDSTGGWTTCDPSMSSWRGSSRNRGARPTT